MANYIDGFVFPIKKKHLSSYQLIAEQIAEIWKEHGALSYREFLGDDLNLKGTKSFSKALGSDKEEVIIFGWVEFESKEHRDSANQKIAQDPRIKHLVLPLLEPELIFESKRMAYGGFKLLIDKA